MKKLMVLAFLVSVVPLAGAGLQWVSSTGSFNMVPGETITLTLKATDGEKASGISIGRITDNGALGGFIAWSFNPGFTTVGSAGVDGATFNSMAGTAYAADDILWLDAISTSAAYSDSLLTLTYRFGADVPGTVIRISGGALATTGQGNEVRLLSGFVNMPEILIVPEPATMALLGFGALMLGRWK